MDSSLISSRISSRDSSIISSRISSKISSMISSFDIMENNFYFENLKNSTVLKKEEEKELFSAYKESSKKFRKEMISILWVARKISEDYDHLKRKKRTVGRLAEDYNSKSNVKIPEQRVDKCLSLLAIILKKKKRPDKKKIYSILEETEIRFSYLENLYNSLLKECNECEVDLENFSVLVASYEKRNSLKNLCISHNLRIVVKIAKKIYSPIMTEISLDDLIQTGNLGLMRAIDKFNPDLGYKFSTYATYWITNFIHRMLTQSREIQIPFHVIELMQKYEKAKVVFLSENKRYPTKEELQKILRVNEENWELLLRSRKMRTVSYDSPLKVNSRSRDGGTLKLIDTFSSSSDVDLDLENSIRLEAIFSVISSFKKRDREIIKRRFGIGYDKCSTLQEIGDKLGITRERVRQLEGRLLISIREKLNTNDLSK